VKHAESSCLESGSARRVNAINMMSVWGLPDRCHLVSLVSWLYQCVCIVKYCIAGRRPRAGLTQECNHPGEGACVHVDVVSRVSTSR